MKILIDLSGCDVRYSSVTVLSLRLLKGLVDNGVTDITILCNKQVIDAVTECCPNYNIVPIQIERTISLFNVCRAFFRWKSMVKKLDFDIIYLPHPFPPFHCILKKGKIITTMLDIEGIKGYHGLKLMVFKMIYPFVLKRSHKITTISEFVKQDILKTYPSISDTKIKPLHLSVVVGTPKEEKNPIEAKYILYVSSFLPHKNVITLLKAFNQIKDRIPHKLVLVGRANDYWREIASPYIRKNKLESRIIHVSNGLTDDELAQYYKYADLFVHPSYMEGFGFPPIEAAILGTPVLTTKMTSIPEVTMNLLNYYDPATDEIELANKIMFVLHNKPSTDELEKISSIYSEKYNYRKIAKELYNELIETNP